MRRLGLQILSGLLSVRLGAEASARGSHEIVEGRSRIKWDNETISAKAVANLNNRLKKSGPRA